jgi:hypothetical protein
MWPLGRRWIMLVMAHSLSSSKLSLVADPRPSSSERTSAHLRRFRISRLRLEGRLADPALRFEHLKRVYE